MSDKIEEHFEKQLDRTNTWLSFAEAKNAALVAFNVASIAAISNFYSNFVCYVTILIVLFLASTIVALFSFLPKVMNRPQNYTNHQVPNNLLFWGDIACFKSEEDYISNTIQRYFSCSAHSEYMSKKNIDFASEIIINSRIVAQKYKVFQKALKIDFVAIGLAVAFLIIA